MLVAIGVQGMTKTGKTGAGMDGLVNDEEGLSEREPHDRAA